jgi:copper chaperone
MKTVIYSVPKIHCMNCVNTIQNELAEMQGIHTVKADADSKNVEIIFDVPATEERIKALLAEINFPVAD